MRIRNVLLLLGLAGLTLAVGCGPNEIEMGDGGSNPTPTPTATPTGTATPTATPDPATFTPVQTFLEIGGNPNRANCGNAGCHVPPTGQSGIALFTAPGTAAGDVASNAETFSCSPNLDAYDPPSGLIYDTFCTASGTVVGMTQHTGRTNLVDADCAALKTFLEGGSGTPPACP